MLQPDCLSSKRSREFDTIEILNKKPHRESKVDHFSKMPIEVLRNDLLKLFEIKENYFAKLLSHELSSLASVSKFWMKIITDIRKNDRELVKKFGFNKEIVSDYDEFMSDDFNIHDEDLVIRFAPRDTSANAQKIVDSFFQRCKSVQHMLLYTSLSLYTPETINSRLTEFKMFGNLKTLHLIQMKALEQLPYGLTRLTQLNIKQSGIKELPSDINLLRWLNCSHTPIARLPATLSILEYLDCESCKEIQLPRGLPNICYLNGGYTEITELPENMGKLQTLELYSARKIKKLPSGLISLKVLEVSRCQDFNGTIPNDVPRDITIGHGGIKIYRAEKEVGIDIHID